MRSLKKFPELLGKHLRFLRRKKEEVVEIEKPEVEVKEEFPGISSAERIGHVGKHVAIVGGKIIASASDAEGVLKLAKRGHPSEEIVLRYVLNERLLLKCKCLEAKA